MGRRSFIKAGLSRLRGMRSIVAAGHVTRQEFHANEEDSFGFAPASAPGAIVRSGIHPTSVRNTLALRSRGRGRVCRCGGRLCGSPGLHVALDKVRWTRHYHRGNRVLEDQLLLVVGVQNHRILIEGANATRQFDSAQQIDSNYGLVLASRIEKGILNVLCWLVFHGWSSLQPAKKPSPRDRGPKTFPGL